MVRPIHVVTRMLLRGCANWSWCWVTWASQWRTPRSRWRLPTGAELSSKDGRARDRACQRTPPGTWSWCIAWPVRGGRDPPGWVENEVSPSEFAWVSCSLASACSAVTKTGPTPDRPAGLSRAWWRACGYRGGVGQVGTGVAVAHKSPNPDATWSAFGTSRLDLPYSFAGLRKQKTARSSHEIPTPFAVTCYDGKL